MGEVRAMEADQLGQVRDLLDGIFRHRHGVFDQTVLTDFPLVFAPANHVNCRLIMLGDRVVSHAAIWPRELVVHGRRLKCGVIVLVATHEEHRRRGHAARLMRALQQTLVDEAYDLGILWTRLPGFYEKFGWQVVRPHGWMLDDARVHNLDGLLIDNSSRCVERYSEQEHLDAIRRIHDREAVVMSRTAAEFATLLQLPKTRTWVLRGTTEGVAYLVVGEAYNKQGIVEYGGAWMDVARLSAQVLGTQSFGRPMAMRYFAPYRELAQFFAAAGGRLDPLESSKGRGYEMVLAVGHRHLARDVLDQVFVWGLDVA